METVLRVLEDGRYLYRGVGVGFRETSKSEYRNGKLIKVRTKVKEEDLIFLPGGTVPRIISDELYEKVMLVGEAMKQDSPKANKNPEATLLRNCLN